MKDSNGSALPSRAKAKSSRPESDKDLGLVYSSRESMDPASLGLTTINADQKPHGPPKGACSADSARKKASNFGGNFKHC